MSLLTKQDNLENIEDGRINQPCKNLYLGTMMVYNPRNIFGNNYEIFANIQLDAICLTNFVIELYPASTVSVNRFCPLCNKYVFKRDYFRVFMSPRFGNYYLAHCYCIDRSEIGWLNTITEHVKYATLTKVDGQTVLTDHCARPGTVFGIHRQYYFVEMVLSHPLSSLTFLRNQTVIRKVSTSLHWQLYNPKQMENYTPNVICLPMQDFELKVVVSEIDTGIRKFVYRSYINCMRRFGGDYVQAETEYLVCVFRVVAEEQDKRYAINTMNFKYKYPGDIPYPLIELQALTVMFSQNDSYDDEEDTFEDLMQMNSQISKLLNECTDNYYQTPSLTINHNEYRTRKQWCH